MKVSQPQKISELFGLGPEKKPPAHPWQELALRVIEQLDVPSIKRNSVFLVCKKYPQTFIEKCLTDTKELCTTSDCWRYFFKLIEKHHPQQKK